DAGTYTITVAISDGGTQDANCAAGADGTTSVTVADAPPTISSSDVHVCEGATTAPNSGSFADCNDAVAVSETGGIGTVTGGPGLSGTWNWSYSGASLAVGTYTVSLQATNADGSTATTSFDVHVGNETPTVSSVTVSPSGTITEGSTAVSVSGNWSDPGNGL